MAFTRGFPFVVFLLTCSHLAEARLSVRNSPGKGELKAVQVKQANVDKARISPELEPESSEKFFKKDYPYDHRPVADPFHFKHPYPVIQDSNEYDKDYVKDENSDNGSWKAQMTYDRLRAKLAKEKEDVAKAEAKKKEEWEELQDALKRRDEGARAEEDAKKNRDLKKHEEDEAKKAAARTDEAPGKAGDVSTKEVEKEMSDLEKCKKELAEAQKKLKEMTKELEEAKSKQQTANAAADDALKRELTARETHESMKGKVKSEYEEYQAAQEAYLKQKALIKKMEADVKIAADKVRKMRDSADADGGVYPVNVKSGAHTGRCLSAMLLVAVVSVAFQ